MLLDSIYSCIAGANISLIIYATMYLLYIRAIEVTKSHTFVSLDHKTSHKGQFFKIEIYTSSEPWINKL